MKFVKYHRVKCPICKGDGRIEEEQCKYCDGNGYEILSEWEGSVTYPVTPAMNKNKDFNNE